MNEKYSYIHTMGCQMNVYDSWQIQNRLAPLGYLPAEEPEQADIIILNTCCIREKAQQKAFSFLGRLADLKQRNPELIIGVAGCVAQQEGQRLLNRLPYVDLVFGTHAIHRLGSLIERIDRSRDRIVDIDLNPAVAPDDYTLGPLPQSDTSAYVTIMRGCDNFCTYCVVPYVRGRESSRMPEEVLSEIRHLVSGGIREVTLLGQNVNSYGRKEKLCSFADLLNQVDRIKGLKRIRFTTSHPKDLSEELMKAFGSLRKLCHHIHLPVQSGSDRILKRMNRRYTSDDYMRKVEQLRSICPDIAITSDIIVGFPGETAENFEATSKLIQSVAFDGLFVFAYSDRPHTKAEKFDRKVDEKEKKDRLQAVLAIQDKITRKRNKDLVGTVQQILVDGFGKTVGQAQPTGDTPIHGNKRQWTGRTSTNKIVHFAADSQDDTPNLLLTGRLMNIMIERAMPHCLWGRPSAP